MTEEPATENRFEHCEHFRAGEPMVWGWNGGCEKCNRAREARGEWYH